jgi:tRNA1(Val) A37 N6-methylase TrmN6
MSEWGCPVLEAASAVQEQQSAVMITNGEAAFVFWRVLFTDGLGNSVHLYFDDETGSPLGLGYRMGKGKPADLESWSYMLLSLIAEMNGLSERLITVEADVRTVDENTLGGRVDVVFSNPPYMRADCGRENAESMKNIARREVLGGIFDFCACAARILKYGGIFYTVYRPERLPDLMEALRANRLEPKKLTFVHATAEKAPSMVLVASRLGGNPSLTVTPPLLVYRSPESREYTDAMKQIYESCSFEELEGF